MHHHALTDSSVHLVSPLSKMNKQHQTATIKGAAYLLLGV